MSDAAGIAARPITVQLPVTMTAIVHSEPDVGGYSAEVPTLGG